MWACPSAGVWLVAVLILISCRPLERQLGPAKFTVSSHMINIDHVIIM